MKKHYNIACCETTPDWDNIEGAAVREYVWGGDYRPETTAKLAVSGGALLLHMTCREENPKAVYKNHNDPVCRDSCLEFFFGAEEGGAYMNFEMNSIGTSLCEYGEGRHGRVYVNTFAQPPKPEITRENGSWSVTVRFEPDFLDRVFAGKLKLVRGGVFYANFYKCGDDTEHEHYGMWNPVGTEKPDFHRPEYFGVINIK
ncbi:MAG: carbohydrate-binding family 9-like protein [Eubacteriales bacterium]